LQHFRQLVPEQPNRDTTNKVSILVVFDVINTLRLNLGIPYPIRVRILAIVIIIIVIVMISTATNLIIMPSRTTKHPAYGRYIHNQKVSEQRGHWHCTDGKNNGTLQSRALDRAP